VAIDGATLIVGAPGHNGNNGAAYVYVQSGAAWTLQQELTVPATPFADNEAGAGVAISGNTVAVGNGGSGGPYLFTRSGASWTRQQYFMDPATDSNHSFGGAVALFGPTFVVGAPWLALGLAGQQGAAYIQNWSDTSTATATVNVTTQGTQTFPISSIGAQTVADGSTLAFTVTATSLDSSPLIFSLGAGAPKGAVINPQTGAFSWTPSESNGITPGVYTFSASAKDTTDAQVAGSGTFTVTVGPSSTNQGSGIVARTKVALGLTQSAEYYSNVITTAYNQYLGRGPDASGLAYWVNQMQFKGLSDEHLEAGFIGSAEYIANHGGQGAGWIQGMYQNLLGRKPAASEVQYWLNQLAAGESTTAIAYGFAASAERESQRVQSDYTQYLGRSASPSEVAYWVNVFLSGSSNEQVVAGFISSQEYFQNHGGNIVDWLFVAYRAVLNRPPDSAESQYWESQLQQ
jgi:hypothetical protein